MEKLPKLEREEGETIGGTSPRMRKDDSEAQKFREVNDGRDQAWTCISGVGETTAKTV
jgi:hypothetical protein